MKHGMYISGGVSEPMLGYSWAWTFGLYHPCILLSGCNGLVLGLILIILVEILHFDLSLSNVCEALKNNNQNLISSRQSVQTF